MMSSHIQYRFITNRNLGTNHFSSIYGLILILLIASIVAIVENFSISIPIFSGLLFVLGALIVTIQTDDYYETSYLKAIFAYGFLIRIIYAICIFYWLTYVRGDAFLGDYTDDNTYEQYSNELYRLWKLGDFELPYYMSHHPGYLVLSAAIHGIGEYIGGYHLLLTRIFNAFIGALIAPCVYILAKNIYSRHTARTACLMVMLYPNLILYSSIQLRDIIIIFLFVFALSQLSCFIAKGKSTGIVLALISVAPMLYMRTVYGFLLLGIIIACLSLFFVFQSGHKKRFLFGKLVSLGITAVAIMYFMKSMEGGLDQVADLENSQLTRPLEEGYVESKVFSQRDHSLAVKTDNSLGALILSRMPFGIGFVILPMIGFIMPYPPWAVLAKPDPLVIIYFFNAVAWTILMPMCFFGLIKVWRKNFPTNLLILLPLFLILIACSSGGFTDRYKLPAIPFMLILGAIGLGIIREKGNNQGARFYATVQIGLLLSYFGAKTVFFFL